MRDQTLKDRVEILEHKVESLEQLPGRVASLELQISQFRQEVRVEFSALRGEMDGFRIEMRGEMSGFRATVSAEFVQVRTEMRVLHEEVTSRIALLDESLNGSGKRGRGTRQRPPKR